MSEERRDARPCPACGGPLVRVRRRREDRLLRDAESGRSMRRYHCWAETCGWSGLLPRRSRRPPPLLAPLARQRAWSAVRVPWARVGGVLLAASLTVLAGTQGVRMAFAPSTPPALVALAPSPERSVPAGDSYDGDPLPRRHPWLQPVVLQTPDPALPEQAAEPLAMRRGCAWGVPGRNPYRGTVEQALVHARLPADVVKEVARRVRTRQTSDRLEIRTGRIHGVQHGREFDPNRFAMSFGHTLCLSSRVNFAPGHVEMADLYEVADAKGQRYAVMVPDVCGNVSVLGERGEKRRPMAMLTAGAPADEWFVLATGDVPGDPNSVPLPGSLALALLALAAVCATRRRPACLN